MRTAVAIPRYIAAAKLLWVAVLLMLVAWLVAADLVPSGRMELTGLPAGSPYLRGPVPESRVERHTGGEADDGMSYRIVGEPVYVDIQQPRPFRTVTVRLELEPGSAEVIEVGLQDRAGSSLSLKPAYHRALDQLAGQAEWTEIRYGGVTLLQRGLVYADLASFFRQPPEPSRLAVYRASVDVPPQTAALPPAGPTGTVDFILTDYLPSPSAQGWRPVMVTFSLTAVQAQAEQLRVVLSVPERPRPAVPPRFRLPAVTLAGDRIGARVLQGWLARWFR